MIVPGEILLYPNFSATAEDHYIVILRITNGTVYFRDATQAERLAFRLGMRQVPDVSSAQRSN